MTVSDSFDRLFARLSDASCYLVSSGDSDSDSSFFIRTSSPSHLYILAVHCSSMHIQHCPGSASFCILIKRSDCFLELSFVLLKLLKRNDY